MLVQFLSVCLLQVLVKDRQTENYRGGQSLQTNYHTDRHMKTTADRRNMTE